MSSLVGFFFALKKQNKDMLKDILQKQVVDLSNFGGTNLYILDE